MTDTPAPGGNPDAIIQKAVRQVQETASKVVDEEMAKVGVRIESRLKGAWWRRASSYYCIGSGLVAGTIVGFFWGGAGTVTQERFKRETTSLRDQLKTATDSLTAAEKKLKEPQTASFNVESTLVLYGQKDNPQNQTLSVPGGWFKGQSETALITKLGNIGLIAQADPLGPTTVLVSDPRWDNDTLIVLPEHLLQSEAGLLALASVYKSHIEPDMARAKKEDKRLVFWVGEKDGTVTVVRDQGGQKQDTTLIYQGPLVPPVETTPPAP